MSTYKGFDSVELTRPKRSLFDLSHEKRLSTRMGKLTPVFISETMPNDTFIVNSEVMLRLAPLIAPIMHRVNVFVHFFFVPNRLLWEDWEPFITGGRLGTETPPVPPFFQFGNIQGTGSNFLIAGTLADYLGIPNIDETALGTYAANASIDLMPFAAYYKVWEDYYRDRNYTDDTTLLPLPSGELDSLSDIGQFLGIRYRAWEHDYFTSALPWPQRGDQVLVPFSADVVYRDEAVLWRSDTNSPVVSSLTMETKGTADGRIGVNGLATATQIHNIESITNGSTTINDLRRSARLQEWLERNALAGSRYSESIFAHFGRRTSDSRLQRAEYLGGGKVSVKISEVVTTAFSQDSEAATVPPASMSGHGLSFGNTNRVVYNCEEHGFVIGIMSVMPTSAYMQGIPRMFNRRNTFLDYPWPTMANLGEQEVYNNEIYMSPATYPVDRETASIFGYQSRYADWKFISSSSHGDFRSSLDFWHLTRKFSELPVLGETFVTFEDSLQNRVFAVEDVDTLWCYIYNDCKVKRSLPYFGTPML